DQVIQTVSQIADIYWDLVNAYENVKAKERALALAPKTLSDNQKQVQIGTLAPIEVVRAQSTVALLQSAPMSQFAPASDCRIASFAPAPERVPSPSHSR